MIQLSVQHISIPVSHESARTPRFPQDFGLDTERMGDYCSLRGEGQCGKPNCSWRPTILRPGHELTFSGLKVVHTKSIGDVARYLEPCPTTLANLVVKTVVAFKKGISPFFET